MVKNLPASVGDIRDMGSIPDWGTDFTCCVVRPEAKIKEKRSYTVTVEDSMEIP